jgi:hypothetical protein
MKLIVATCQFPVDADIRRNTEYVVRQMRHRQGSFVRPDDVITGSLRRNTAGILLSTVDTNARLYDSTFAWRDRAMRGVFHSGEIVKDPRSDQRRRL